MAKNLALIYTRKSVAIRGADDKFSEKRQEANCIRIAEARGWHYELYSDFTAGHHSGRSDRNRPGWAQLKAQLQRPEVAAVVVEQSSRSYRNVRLLLDLLDNELIPRKIKLVLATMPEVDPATAAGRNLLISLANADEYQSRITGETMKLAIQSFTRNGRNWGAPVYGLVSEGKGYERVLKRSEAGVWWKGNLCKEGVESESPGRGWTFRGDYDACLAIWEKYVTEDIGARHLADYANACGYRYQSSDDRRRRPFDNNSIRCVLESWVIYAGYVRTGRRNATQIVSKARFKPLADPKLLASVGARFRDRSYRRLNHGPQHHPPLLLQGILHCGKCGSRYYADPGRKATHTPHYYHHGRDCDEPRYITAGKLDEQALKWFDKLHLTDAIIAEIARAETGKRKQEPDAGSRQKAKLLRLGRELRALGLDDSQIQAQLANVESELRTDLPAPSDELAPVSLQEAGRLLKQYGVLLRRSRVDEPIAANQVIRAVFERIAVRRGRLSYRVHAWVKPFCN